MIVSDHHFADENSLNNIATTVDSLKQTLESECSPAKLSQVPASAPDKRKSNNDVKFVIATEETQAVSLELT